MAVIITDTRVIPTEADATTGWTASDGVTVFTSNPNPVEATGSLGQQVSNATETAYFSTTTNLTNTLVYCWLLPQGVMDTTANGGVQIYLGDNTNNIGYHVGGSNGAGFRHTDGPVLWQCFVIDTGSLPATTTAFNGNAGSINLTNITRIGNAFKTLQKSVGGVENCFMDLIAYGNGGLIITGGGTGTEGKFLEIAQRDRAETDHPGQNVASSTGAAYGIIRELASDTFGLQGPFTFGDASGTGSVDFEDTAQTIVFEDRGFSTDKYFITVTGNATGTTTFILGTRGTNAGEGSAGCTLTVPPAVGAAFTASSANINSLGLYATTFDGFDQGFTFTTDGTAGPNHEIFACVFRNCSQITVGTTEFKNNTIRNTTSTGTAEAAVLLNNTTNVSDLMFVSGGTGHAIEISDATNSPFTFNNFTYDGYAATNGGTGNEVIVNTSGSPITINVSGGDTPTVDTTNSTGTVTIISTITLAFSQLKDGTEVRVFEAGTTTAVAGVETLSGGTGTGLTGPDAAASGSTDDNTFSFTATVGASYDIRIFNLNWIAEPLFAFAVPSTNTTIPIQQVTDRVFSNP
jgi:hypothetical protein